MRPTRVFMVTYSAPPIFSGAGRQATLLARRLRERNVLVTVVTARHLMELADRENNDGVEIIRLPVTHNRRTRPLSFSVSAAAYILRQRRHVDIVHIHGAYWRIVPPILVSQGKRVKSVVKMTSLGTDDPTTIATRRLGRVLLAALRRSDAVVATTEQMARSYLDAELPAEKLRRIPNGVDTECYRPATDQQRRVLRQQLGLPDLAPVVLFTGWLIPRKGADLLFGAWELVKEQVSDAILLLVGPEGVTNSSQWLRDQFANLQAHHDVVYIGYQDDVTQFYQLADIFILPTRLEGMSNALLEAMSSALPAIMTRIAGSSTVVTDNVDGLLVEPESEEAIAEALLRLLGDPALRSKLGRQARRKIMDRFSINAVADSYVELYRELLGSN